MPPQPRSNFIGLVTNVAETQAPPGALLDADNVVIRRAGQIEPRNGIERAIDTGANYTPVHGFCYQASDCYAKLNSGAFSWVSSVAGALEYADPLLGTIDPQPFRRDMWTETLSRGNLYLPYEAGVLKLDDDAGPFLMAGLPLYVSVFGASANALAGAWLPNTEKVAYRLLGKRTDENGVEVRSIPTGAYTVTNGSGGAAGVLMLLFVTNTSLFDEIEIYRTRNFASSVTVDDEMQLVATVPSTTTAWADGIAVTARGATMYTSPSRGGIIKQNDRPPACACVAPYKGSLFFGNTRGPSRVKLSFTYAAGLTVATGIGDRTYTATTTNANNQLTLLSSTLGLEKGQIVSGTGIPANTWITGIAGTTVTMNNNATASAAGVSITFSDAIYLSATGRWLTPSVFLPAAANAFGFQVYGITPPEGGYSSTLVIETISRAVGAGTIQATHGSEYNPPLPNYDGTPQPLKQDTWPGALYWSKTDEPEHVTPVAYAYVGDKSKAILGLVPTRDALFVVKEDGVWRLTGVKEQWQIDPYDPTTFCVLPTSVRALNGRGYMLGTRGVVRIGDDGVQLISGPINDQVKPLVDGIIDRFNTTGYYEVEDVIGSTGAIFQRESEYLLLRSATDGAWVYNENTDAWTTWTSAYAASEALVCTALFSWPRVAKVVHGLGQYIYTTVLQSATPPGAIDLQGRYDRWQAVTASSYTAGEVTLSAPVTVLEDDAIEDASGALWRVQVDGTAISVLNVSGDTETFTIGACVLYRSQRCRVTPAGFCEPGGTQHVWTTWTAAMTKLVGAHIVRYAYESTTTPHDDVDDWENEQTTVNYRDGMAAHPCGYSYTGPVPNAHQRGWLMHASVRWAICFGDVRLEALFVGGRPMAERSPLQVSP